MNELLIVVLRIVITVAFLSSGIAKLMKAEPLVKQFHEFHLPIEIMYLVGVAEILGAIGLWFDFLEIWAYSCLGCLMLGAIKNHVQAKHSVSKLVPSTVLLGLCVAGVLYVNWLR